MSSIYHIIDKIPIFESEGMVFEYEDIAQELFKSGLVRVDTVNKCNFVRLVDYTKNVSLMISKAQLAEPLLEQTKNRLLRIYHDPKKVDSMISYCYEQMQKNIDVEPEIILKLCRIVAQSTHPIVLKWVLLEQVEIFISYSDNIGDLMDIQTWKHSGSNSGMQSTDGKSVAIYTSCAGNPFTETDPKIRIYGDGWPAVARMQIVIAQELGHYADIKRNDQGHQIGRHAADFACTRPTPKVQNGRMSDIAKCNDTLQMLRQNGIDSLINHETSLKFYRKNKLFNMALIYHIFASWIIKYKLFFAMRKIPFVTKFAQEQYPGLMMKAMIEDMKFNLSPVADVYKRDDTNAELAIACVEALARVPQQAVKWGHITTSYFMENLYKIYYQEVIPDLIRVYQLITNNSYRPNLKRLPYNFTSKIKQIFTKSNLPYRELE